MHRILFVQAELEVTTSALRHDVDAATARLEAAEIERLAMNAQTHASLKQLRFVFALSYILYSVRFSFYFCFTFGLFS